jgi:hypothetical protein
MIRRVPHPCFRFAGPRPNQALILGNRCRAEVLPSPSRYQLMQ